MSKPRVEVIEPPVPLEAHRHRHAHGARLRGPLGEIPYQPRIGTYGTGASREEAELAAVEPPGQDAVRARLPAGFVDPGDMLWAMPRTAQVDGLDELLAKQLSVVSRGQLLALGVTDNAMRYRVRLGGPWQALLPGVYLTVSGTPILRQKEVAALLYAGPGSLITGPVALLHHSVRVRRTWTSSTCWCRSGGSVEHRLRPVAPNGPNADRMSSSGPLRVALVPRAVSDTARQLTSLRDVRAVVAGAVQPGRCTVSQLAVELADGPVRGSAMFRTALSEVAEGIRSTAEADLRDLIKAARLPMPLFNPSLYDGETFIAKPDAWWAEAGVAAEVDSREWHSVPPTGNAPGIVTR